MSTILGLVGYSKGRTLVPPCRPVTGSRPSRSRVVPRAAAVCLDHPGRDHQKNLGKLQSFPNKYWDNHGYLSEYVDSEYTNIFAICV